MEWFTIFLEEHVAKIFEARFVAHSLIIDCLGVTECIYNILTNGNGTFTGLALRLLGYDVTFDCYPIFSNVDFTVPWDLQYVWRNHLIHIVKQEVIKEDSGSGKTNSISFSC